MAEARDLFWKGRRVLVTGATGFIGHALASRLRKLGATLAAIVRSDDWRRPFLLDAPLVKATRIFSGDIRDYQTCLRAFAQFEPDVVFHLAATSQVTEVVRMPLEAFETNVMGTVNMLESLSMMDTIEDMDNRPRMVVVSSDKVYGRPATLPATVDTAFNPYHPYDASKAGGDLAALAYAREYELEVAVVRMANVYGPGDFNWRRIIPGTIRSLLLREPIRLRSQGHQVREYAYIDDVVQNLIETAWTISNLRREDWCGRAFNMAGQAGTPRQIINLLHGIMDLPYPPDIRVTGDAEDETQKLSLAEALPTPWTYKTPRRLTEGLTLTLPWVRKYLTDTGELHG